jgi:hypothetical protein
MSQYSISHAIGVACTAELNGSSSEFGRRLEGQSDLGNEIACLVNELASLKGCGRRVKEAKSNFTAD